MKEYRDLERQKISNTRVAKQSGKYYVPAEPKLVFVVRIKGINKIDPKKRKTLQLLRLLQINNGVFVRMTKATSEMLKIVEYVPIESYGVRHTLTMYQAIRRLRLPEPEERSRTHLQARLREDQPEAAYPSHRQRDRRRASWTVWDGVHGGSDPRDLYCGAELQAGEQLPVAVQAEHSHRRVQATQVQALRRGWRSGQS